MIVKSENHYVAQVKKNQPSLYRSIEKAICEQAPLDRDQAHQKGHGRHDYWDCQVFEALDQIQCEKWQNLKRLIYVRKESFDTKKKKWSVSDNFFISDLDNNDAAFFLKGIRGHWQIENNLHWVKDVIHNEDGNAIKKANAPVNMAVVSTIAINIGRKYGKKSMTENSVNFTANIDKAVSLIRT